MAYDEALAERVRVALGPRPDVSEKKMFGGLAFLVDGKMGVGIVGDELMVKVGADEHDAALARPHTRPMDFTGRPMRGMVFVEPAGLRGKLALARWVEWGARVGKAAAARPSKARKPRPFPAVARKSGKASTARKPRG
jgi:TfoX/Sxy family transcriptional regulator of competence genes